MGIPKSARRLVIHGEEWKWGTDGWRVDIWNPDGKQYKVCAEEAFGQYNKGCDCCTLEPALPIEPGMVRMYIEDHLMKVVPEFVPEEPAVGKLFVYRHKSPRQGASLSVQELKGGDYGSQKERYDVLLQRFADKVPLFLVDYKTLVAEKVSYAKFLVADMIVELKIDYPRTFRASFIRCDDWREMQEVEANAG